MVQNVGVDDPAMQVMTDFRCATAVIILAGDTLNEAHRRMIQRGVRLLLVVDQDRKVVGIITATDVLGEKTMQRSRSAAYRATSCSCGTSDAPAAAGGSASGGGADVQSRHVVATLRRAGRQHTLVVEQNSNGQQVVRGLFSARRLPGNWASPYRRTRWHGRFTRSRPASAVGGRAFDTPRAGAYTASTLESCARGASAFCFLPRVMQSSTREHGRVATLVRRWRRVCSRLATPERCQRRSHHFLCSVHPHLERPS